MLIVSRLLLIAATIRCALASNRSLWADFNGNDLDYVIKESRRALLVFASRTSESVQDYYGFLENLHKDRPLQTRVIMIDCDIEVNLCRQYDVNEYPAIRLFQRGKAEDRFTGEEATLIRYRGRRTEHAIRSFLIKHEYAILSAIGNGEQLSNFKKVDDVAIVAYLSREWSELNRVFYSIAEKYYAKFVFGYTQGEDIAGQEGFTIPSIVCYKNTDGDHKILKGHFTEEDVEVFLATAPKMVIRDFSERNIEAYMAPGKLSAYIFAATVGEATSVRHELTPLARKYEQYVTFGVADAIEYAPMATNFGLANGMFPALAVHAPMNDNVFTYLQGRKIVAEVVENMLLTVLQGEATSGQVFGSDAPKFVDAEAEAEAERRARPRDEL
ncbi:protein disulfide isomerase [Paraphaeosphaeria sporulosa]